MFASNGATSVSKLAPAVAKAGTNILTSNGGTVFTDSLALSYPGLQYGATVASSDQYIMSTKQDVAPFGYAPIPVTLPQQGVEGE